MEEVGTTVEADLANKRFKVSGKKTAEIIAIFSMCALCWIGWVVYTHDASAKEQARTTHEVLKEIAAGIREQTCLQGFPDAERSSKADFCRRVAR